MKRLIDIIVSIFVLFSLLPLLFFLYIMIWKKIGKPVLFSQVRPGINGKPFVMYKFRTMKVVTDLDMPDEYRLTDFGKFLRSTSLDELPELWNVLKGEMAVIGPRPERPIFVNEIAEVMPFYETRHVVKPGLTGWAQVNYPYGENIEDSLIKLQYDLYYIKHRSIFLDINIVFKTLGTVLLYKGQ